MEIKGVITGEIVVSSQIKPDIRADLLTRLAIMEEPNNIVTFDGDAFMYT